ncbi:MAG: methyltransferase domain-containing protein [Bacteroidota bacterium]
MSKITTRKRTDESEIMDDFELKGADLEKTLYDLDNINKWLGGNKITLQGIKILLKDHPKSDPVHIADIGCGNGAILREIAKWGRKENFKLELTGIDANPHAIEIAEKLSYYYPEIKYYPVDIFKEEFEKMKFDILLCTLTLHHFKDSEIDGLVELFLRQSKFGIVINDLQRSKIAYRLFQAFCAVFIRNEIARKDGLTSILRGFKKRDLQVFSKEISVKKQTISWKWAFRYQWIIQK